MSPRFGLVLLTLVALGPSDVLAAHAEPAKGNKATFALVNAYLPCSSPNTATQSDLASACAPPSPASPCALVSGGSEKLTFAKVGSVTDGNQDLKIVAAANGLNAVCENQTLHVRISYRLTTDDCPEGSCTTTDRDFPIFNASCLVTNGKCKINTTLGSAAPTIIPLMGNNTGISIYGCGLSESLPPLYSDVLDCGVVLK